MSLKSIATIATIASLGLISFAYVYAIQPEPQKTSSHNVPSFGVNKKTGRPFYGKMNSPMTVQIEKIDSFNEGKQIRLKAYIQLQELVERDAQITWRLPKEVKLLGSQNTFTTKLNPKEAYEVTADFELQDPDKNQTITINVEFADGGNKRFAAGYFMTNKEKSLEHQLAAPETTQGDDVKSMGFDSKVQKKKRVNIRY